MDKLHFIKRRKKFWEGMQDNSFAIFYSGVAPHKTLDEFYIYTPNRNFFYLTGLEKENFYLLIVKSANKYQEYLFIEEPSDFATKWLGARMTKEEASKISGFDIKDIHYENNLKPIISHRIMLDSRKSAVDQTPDLLYLDLFRHKPMTKPQTVLHFQDIIDVFPELSLKDAGKIISELRRVKSKDEVDEIRKAIYYTKEGIEAVMKYAKSGVSENQIEATYEYYIKLAGSKGISFDTIAAGGKNATVLHYHDNNATIEDGSLVLLDLGSLSNVYASDISRTFPLNGKFSERQKEFYQLVLDVNKNTMARVKPGIMFKELNDFAKEELAKGMIKLGKIKEKSEIDKYYYHTVGHYLGLDVHDVGTYAKPLESGCVITIEPGIYVGDEGIGIRIEDNVLVTAKGYENLSESIIKEIKDIEDFMK